MRYRGLVSSDSVCGWTETDQVVWWAGAEDQRYRATFTECSVDALQWNGAHIARRQVIDPA